MNPYAVGLMEKFENSRILFHSQKWDWYLIEEQNITKCIKEKNTWNKSNSVIEDDDFNSVCSFLQCNLDSVLAVWICSWAWNMQLLSEHANKNDNLILDATFYHANLILF